MISEASITRGSLTRERSSEQNTPGPGGPWIAGVPRKHVETQSHTAWKNWECSYAMYQGKGAGDKGRAKKYG